jgi:hypothetical protein
MLGRLIAARPGPSFTCTIGLDGPLDLEAQSRRSRISDARRGDCQQSLRRPPGPRLVGGAVVQLAKEALAGSYDEAQLSTPIVIDDRWPSRVFGGGVERVPPPLVTAPYSALSAFIGFARGLPAGSRHAVKSEGRRS